MTKHFAVIGNPIAHSLSPVIHQCFAQQTNITLLYERIKGEETFFEQQVIDFFNQGAEGLNVTVPFKQRAFVMAKHHTLRCKQASAANTLWLQDGALWADNTDGIGLLRDLARYLDVSGKNILVLGAGGAARGIIPSLLTRKPRALTLANRTAEKAALLQADFPQIHCRSLTDLSGNFDLIINATSASLEGKNVLLPETLLAQKPFCYDLAYKKKGYTPFVHYAKSLGCEAMDGLGMLVEQAAESFFIWNGTMPDTEQVLTRLAK